MKKALSLFVIGSMLFLPLTSYKCSEEQVLAKDNTNSREYVCMPCGSSCDNSVYSIPGTCQHCNMKLVEKSTVVFNKVEPEVLCSFIDSTGEKNILLLDVRSAEEFEGRAEEKFGSLRNAVNIPVQELERRINELEKYKNKEIIVYCSHSHRSPRASYMLNQNGFKHVTNLEGGMSVWKDRVKEENCNKKLFLQQ